MFEKFTEQARRAVFFARYEASQFGASEIGPEHLLIGILREAKDLMPRLHALNLTVDAVRARIGQDRPSPEKVPVSVDMPVSAVTKRVFACAAEESARFGHEHIGAEHLLLGIAREETCLAVTILRESGLTVDGLRQEAANARPDRPARLETRGILRRFEPEKFETGFLRDLTEAAQKGQLVPLIGREAELDRTIRILSRRTKNNVVLLGEPGVGKTAIVEGLAQRVAGGTIPGLAECRVLAVDANPSSRREFDAVVGRAVEPKGLLLCIEGFFDLAAQRSEWSVMEGMHMLEPHLSRGAVRFIATGTHAGFRRTIEFAPALARRFEAINVEAPGPEETMKVLEGSKSGYEQFHGVVFGEGTLERAVYASGRFLAHRCLPDRALDLMDEAAALVKLRREVNASPKTVAPEDVEQVVANRMGAPISAVKAILAQKEPVPMESIIKELAAGISLEGNEWVGLLAAYIARSSKAEIDALAEAIRAARFG